jgi:CheY-like chemotaxis protein
MRPVRRVLIVEDDDEIRESLADVLEDQGYSVAATANGVEALEALRAGGPRPCLIFLDLMMPLMDGRGFRDDQLRDDELAAIPVVVISAFRDVAADASALSADAWLKKPLRLADVVGVARRFCTGCHEAG